MLNKSENAKKAFFNENVFNTAYATYFEDSEFKTFSL